MLVIASARFYQKNSKTLLKVEMWDVLATYEKYSNQFKAEKNMKRTFSRNNSRHFDGSSLKPNF